MCLAALILIGAMATLGSAVASPDLTWMHIGFYLSTQGDSIWQAAESHTIHFGTLDVSHGFREIPLQHDDRVLEMSVWEGQRRFTEATSATPYTFSTRRIGDILRVDWYFPRASSPERTFTFRYTTYRRPQRLFQRAELTWPIVSSNHSVPIWGARATVYAPPNIDPEAVRIEAYGAETVIRGDSSTSRVLLETVGAVPRGHSWGIKLRYPDQSVLQLEDEDLEARYEWQLGQFDISLATKDRLIVDELWTVHVLSRSVNRFSRTWLTAGVGELGEVELWDGDTKLALSETVIEQGQYRVWFDENDWHVEWSVAPVEVGMVRTFRLHYAIILEQTQRVNVLSWPISVPNSRGMLRRLVVVIHPVGTSPELHWAPIVRTDIDGDVALQQRLGDYEIYLLSDSPPDAMPIVELHRVEPATNGDIHSEQQLDEAKQPKEETLEQEGTPVYQSSVNRRGQNVPTWLLVAGGVLILFGWRLTRHIKALASCGWFLILMGLVLLATPWLGPFARDTGAGFFDALARAKLAESDELSAQVALEWALKIDPEYAPAYADLGYLYFKQNRLDEAMVTLEKAVSLDNTLANAYNTLGQVHHRRGELELAREALTRSVSLEPNESAIRVNLGLVQTALGEWQEAARSYREATRIDPNMVVAHVGLGHALLRQGRQAEALSAFQMATELNPDDSVSHTEAGRIYLEQGELDAAASELDTAVQLNPDSHVALLYSGIVAQAQGRTVEAARIYEYLLEESTDELIRSHAEGRLAGLWGFE